MRGHGWWFFFMIVIILGLIFWSSGGSDITNYAPYYWKWVTGRTATVEIENATFDVEVADTPASRATGLSNRTDLPYDKGMLFVFPEPGIYTFTLRDTALRLDIIWIEDGEVVDIAYNVAPGTEEVVPKAEARHVLELRGRTAERAGIGMGDAVNITF